MHEGLTTTQDDLLDLVVITQVVHRGVPLLLLEIWFERMSFERAKRFVTKLAIRVTDIRQPHDESLVVLALGVLRLHIAWQLPIILLTDILIAGFTFTNALR